MRRDPYEVLGVAHDADEREIKKTFRRVARELHPDVNRHDPGAEEKFKEAAETYDRYGFEGLDSRGFSSQSHGFGSFADIFDAFFGGDPFGGAFGRAGAGRIQGGDLAVEVEVTLADAAAGKTVEVAYELVDTCEHCRGNGAEPGTPIEACPTCNGAGRIRAVTRTAFGQLVREQACDTCGGEGRIPSEPCHECGGRGRRAVRKTLQVDIPAGTQPGTVVTLGERGMPTIGRGRRGDQQVVLNVVIPRKLSGRQRQLLGELRDSLTAENLEEQVDESLLSKVKRALR